MQLSGLCFAYPMHGSGLRFKNRDTRALKGLPEEVRLYRVLA